MKTPHKSDPTDRSPGDFAMVLASDEPLFLVGGQAVNLWALYYHKHTAALAPFVSRDADILGDRGTLLRIAAAVGAEPQIFPMRPPTNEIGVVVAKAIDGTPLPVEVLRHLHGIDNETLRRPTYTMAIGETGVLVRVPGPIALLQAKTANVADIAQNGRRDTRHIQILVRLMPVYLADLDASVTDGRLNERDMISLLERLLKTVSTPAACRIARELDISWQDLFVGIRASRHSKVQAFATKRLAQIFDAK